MTKLKTSKEVLDELKKLLADIIKSFNASDWQKERDFYEARFFFLKGIIKHIENKMDKPYGQS